MERGTWQAHRYLEGWLDKVRNRKHELISTCRGIGVQVEWQVRSYRTWSWWICGVDTEMEAEETFQEHHLWTDRRLLYSAVFSVSSLSIKVTEYIYARLWWLRTQAYEQLGCQHVWKRDKVFTRSFTYIYLFRRVWHGEGNGNPLQYSCLGNPMDGGAW